MLHFVQQPVANFDVVPPLRTAAFFGPITNAPNNASEPNQPRIVLVVTYSFHPLAFFFTNLWLLKHFFFLLNLNSNHTFLPRATQAFKINPDGCFPICHMVTRSLKPTFCQSTHLCAGVNMSDRRYVHLLC